MKLEFVLRGNHSNLRCKELRQAMNHPWKHGACSRHASESQGLLLRLPFGRSARNGHVAGLQIRGSARVNQPVRLICSIATSTYPRARPEGRFLAQTQAERSIPFGVASCGRPMKQKDKEGYHLSGGGALGRELGSITCQVAVCCRCSFKVEVSLTSDSRLLKAIKLWQSSRRVLQRFWHKLVNTPI